MDNNSTQLPTHTLSENHETSMPAATPKQSTLDTIRQFARIYMPVGSMPGIVLN